MRVLHLDAGLEMRGGQWQALRLCEGLAGAGHTALLLAPAGSPCFESGRKMGIDVQPLSAAAVRKWSAGFDLAHAHDARSHTLAALASKAPLVVSRRVSFPIQGGLSRWKYGRARRYIAVSRHVAGVLESAGIAAARISVVYDGVPLLPPSIASQRVLVLSSLDPKKGTDLALEAAALAGVNPHLATDLERDLADAGMFVYITHSEGLGSGALLAMSAAVPVVASDVGGLPEVIDHGRTGLLTPNTPQDIAAAILRIRNDHDFARTLATRARRAVEERFSISRMIEETVRVYDQTLGSPL
jgi:glycosyltransferase involved in cell wall biosynthesis